MKAKRKTKQTDKRETERAETTRGAQAAQGAAANGANPSGGDSGAECCRVPPAWVHESELEDFNGNFEPSPLLYNSACAFIWDEAQRAIENGDSDLLSREGIADALQFVSCPYNAGTGAADYAFILEDWKKSQATKNKVAEFERKQTDAQKLIRRVQFFAWIDKTKKPDDEARRFRYAMFSGNPYNAGFFQTIRELKDKAGTTEDLAQVDKIVDAVFEGVYPIEKKPNKSRVIAEWANATFSYAGEVLAAWINAAVVKDCRNEIAELRESIADNYGIFPAPFGYSDLGVEMINFELRKLFFVSRAMSQPKEHLNDENERAITIPAFAKQMGVKPRTVYNWLNGKTKAPEAMGVKFSRGILKDRTSAVMFAYNYKNDAALRLQGTIDKTDKGAIETTMHDLAGLKNGLA